MDPIRTFSYPGRLHLPMEFVYLSPFLKMDLLCLEHLDFNQGGSEICGMDILHSWIPDPPAGPMAVTDPLIIKKSAPKETDWEEKKPAIEHIYLTENQTLNDTMTCMREQHGFTAT